MKKSISKFLSVVLVIATLISSFSIASSALYADTAGRYSSTVYEFNDVRFNFTNSGVVTYSRNKRTGYCYGIAVVAGLLVSKGSPINPGCFKYNAKLPSELSLSDKSTNSSTLFDTIDKIQAYAQPSLKKNTKDYDAFFKQVRTQIATKKLPIICMRQKLTWWQKHIKKLTANAHAILAYKVVYKSSSEVYIYCYDSNSSSSDAYMILTKNSSSNITGWNYDTNVDQSTYDIFCITYDEYYEKSSDYISGISLVEGP